MVVIKAMFLMMDPDLQVNAIAITELPLFSEQKVDLIVIGGGPAGFMCAITAAESGFSSVLVLEGTLNPLHKVLISGGGRCNVTNACWDPSDLVINYPRGRVALLSPFSRFASGDIVGWFADRGVDLVIEPDGRMFPKSNSSSSVVRCLRKTAEANGVNVITNEFVRKLEINESKEFLVKSRSGKSWASSKVLLATGGHPLGRRLAESLGHQIIPPVPSLFTLSLESKELISCSGIALDDVDLSLCTDREEFQQIGKVLITHWGLSGPAILRLTAFAARALHSLRYRTELKVNWLGSYTIENVIDLFDEYRKIYAKRTIASAKPFSNLPRRFWLTLLTQTGLDLKLRWADLPSKLERKLINKLVDSRYVIKNKGPFGEEFVTAGGVNLVEVNMTTMESRICPGLFFAGEILDVDGVTGGFNFQHCWTSGWLAGQSIVNKKNL